MWQSLQKAMVVTITKGNSGYPHKRQSCGGMITSQPTDKVKYFYNLLYIQGKILTNLF